MNAAQPSHPALELLARYRAVFVAAWAHRHELAGPKRLADEAAFLPAALSLQETPVHPAPRRLAMSIIVLFVLALAWSIFGKVDIVAVAPGRIVVSERTKVVQPLERSVVQRILVKDGDRVQAGQALIELDPTSAHADRTSLGEQLKSAQSEWLRARTLLHALSEQQRWADSPASASRPALLKAELPQEWSEDDQATANIQLASEWGDITAKLAKLRAEMARRRAEIGTVQATIAKLQSTLPLVQRREADFARLAEQGFMSGHATQDRARERIELERDLSTQRARLAETQAALSESEKAQAAYLAETTRTLRQAQATADLKRQQATQELAKANQRERLSTLIAPVAGVVQQLAIHTDGGVVTEAQPLLVIVPEDATVTAEVTVENKDIGFVGVGQEAEIKLETFPFTRYGTVKAVVRTVTADAVTE